MNCNFFHRYKDIHDLYKYLFMGLQKFDEQNAQRIKSQHAMLMDEMKQFRQKILKEAVSNAKSAVQLA